MSDVPQLQLPVLKEKDPLNVSPELLKKAERMLDYSSGLRHFMMMYQCAIREVQTKLEVLNDELSLVNNRNPIESIKSRVKQPMSIVKKLSARGLDVSIENAQNELSDIAGIRVICSFIDDIYAVADMLISQDDIRLLEIKDYIKLPKSSGYRSLHLIVEVPIYLSDGKYKVKVEIQIRTIAMDFWASLEHKLKYKQDIEDVEAITIELKACADVISATDIHMQSLRDRIEVLSNKSDT